MVLESPEDRFFVLLYLDVGRKDKHERIWMFTKQSKNYVIGPMFKELGLREERKEKKEEGMYG